MLLCWMVFSNNASVSTSIFTQLDGFSQSFSDDVIILYYWVPSAVLVVRNDMIAKCHQCTLW